MSTPRCRSARCRFGPPRGPGGGRDDAVMVLRSEQAEAVVRMATDRAAREAGTMRQAVNGSTPHNMQKLFSGDRVEKLDRPWTEADGLGKV